MRPLYLNYKSENLLNEIAQNKRICLRTNEIAARDQFISAKLRLQNREKKCINRESGRK